jgi:glycosyltransferase involved in cell wall biosynthesis
MTDSRPRLLEVLFSFRTGGSEVVGLELAQQLSEAGVEVMCTAIDGVTGPLRDQCAAIGLPVIDLGLPYLDILRRNGFSLSLARRLRDLRLDAIHLQHFLSFYKCGPAARLAGIPRIVVTEHSDEKIREYAHQRVRLRCAWRLAHQITVIHQAMADYLCHQLHIPPSRITVIPNGIDAARWHRRDRQQCRAALGLGEEFVFMFVGRLASGKNVPELIRVFLASQSTFPRPGRLLVVGDGADMAACRSALADHPGAESVKLLGEQRDTRPFLAAADALVLNSFSEGVPRALIEAMCMGLPAIATAVGGIPALLKEHGWLTRVGDPESLKSALLDAATHPERAAHFGEQGEAYVRSRYDYREVIPHYLEALGLCQSATLPAAASDS